MMISVIVPVHNGARHIKRCINSIISSSYQNFEIIIVENGSTDNTYELCKNLSENDGRIKLIFTTQCGVSNARNIGIDNAHGDWISFIDADDYISPVMLGKLMETTVEYSADMVFCDCIHGNEEFFDFSEIKGGIDDINCNVKEMTLDTFFYETYMRAQYKYSVVFNKLFSRKRLGKMRFDCNLYYIEDRNFVIQYVLNCNRIISIPDKLYYYYQNENSISNSADQKTRMGQVYATLSDIEALKCCGAKSLYCDYAYANLLQLADFRMRQAPKYHCQEIQNELLPIISHAKAAVFRGKLKITEKIHFWGEHYYYTVKEILNE